MQRYNTNILRYFEHVMDTTQLLQMARPNQTRFAFLITIICLVFLFETSRVNSDSSGDSSTYWKKRAPFIPGAVAYWPMTGETRGDDLSWYDNHAVFEGLTHTDGPDGEYNGAVHFSGSRNSFASVQNSPSMDLGQYQGFTFTGFVRLNINNDYAALIDWSSEDGYGVFIVASPVIQLQLYPRKHAIKHKAEFLHQRLTNGSWYFIGLSYDKDTGKATAFIDGKQDVNELDKNITAGTDKTREIGLGIELPKHKFNYHGDMSCMMLFKFVLTEDNFNRVSDFCRKTNSAKTVLPKNITVSDIGQTNATASWTKSLGIFSKYNITVEHKDAKLGLETVLPNLISSSETNPKSVLTNLIPGTTYRVHVWHMQGNIIGRERSSEWFYTAPILFVGPDSIVFSEITATSANISWKDVTGNYDGYVVDIIPNTREAKAGPPLPKGMTTMNFTDLSPGSFYKITIKTKIGSSESSPSMKSFQTLELATVESGSIIFSQITATSAKVSWKNVTGNFANYSVDISPTTEGAKADPSIVRRGTTTTSLQNLSPGSNYIVTIRTQIGSRTSSPSVQSFQTLRIVTGAETRRLAISGLILPVIYIVLIALKVFWPKIYPIISCRNNDHPNEVYQSPSTDAAANTEDDSGQNTPSELDLLMANDDGDAKPNSSHETISLKNIDDNSCTSEEEPHLKEEATSL